MIEKEVSIQSHGVVLSATHCLPNENGTFPTALWIQGSGPLDRNDNIRGQVLDNAKIVTHHLAEQGIASLRFDKRGVGKSTGTFLATGHSDFVADSKSCLDFLSSHENCDPKRLYAIGHSEGAIIAPQLALAAEEIAGIILLCPFIEDLESVLMRQAKEVKKMTAKAAWTKWPMAKLLWTVLDPVKNQRALLDKVKNSEDIVGRIWLVKQPFHWFRQIIVLNPKEIFKKVKCPTLAIAGSKDIQCLPSDADRIGATISGNYESHIIEDMSHLLRNEPNEPDIYNYGDQLKQAIEPKVLEILTAWILKTNASVG